MPLANTSAASNQDWLEHRVCSEAVDNEKQKTSVCNAVKCEVVLSLLYELHGAKKRLPWKVDTHLRIYTFM